MQDLAQFIQIHAKQKGYEVILLKFSWIKWDLEMDFKFQLHI